MRPGLKLCDFGLARIYEDPNQPLLWSGCVARSITCHQNAWGGGVIRGHGQTRPGVLAYAMASGRLPFSGLRGRELMRAHISEIPPVLPHRRGFYRVFRMARYVDVQGRWSRFVKPPMQHTHCVSCPSRTNPGRTNGVTDLAMVLGITDTLRAHPSSQTRSDTHTMDFTETVMSRPQR